MFLVEQDDETGHGEEVAEECKGGAMLEFIRTVGSCKTPERCGDEDRDNERLNVTWGLSNGELIDDCGGEDGNAINSNRGAAGKGCAARVC